MSNVRTSSLFLSSFSVGAKGAGKGADVSTGMGQGLRLHTTSERSEDSDGTMSTIDMSEAMGGGSIVADYEYREGEEDELPVVENYDDYDEVDLTLEYEMCYIESNVESTRISRMDDNHINNNNRDNSDNSENSGNSDNSDGNKDEMRRSSRFRHTLSPLQELELKGVRI